MSLEQFFEKEKHDSVDVSKIIRDRIMVAVAAWSYEFTRSPIMSDGEFDNLAMEVDKNKKIKTGNKELDKFFETEFQPNTGLWVHIHPDKPGLENIYIRYFET